MTTTIDFFRVSFLFFLPNGLFFARSVVSPRLFFFIFILLPFFFGCEMGVRDVGTYFHRNAITFHWIAFPRFFFVRGMSFYWCAFSAPAEVLLIFF